MSASAANPLPTPSQTVGPFYGYALPFPRGGEVAPVGHPDTITLHGYVYDGAGQPVPDALIETWQPAPDCSRAGAPRIAAARPRDGAAVGRDGVAFTGFGRVPTDADGHWAVRTLPPGGVSYISLAVFARGLLHHLYTRAYLVEEPGVRAARLAGRRPARHADRPERGPAHVPLRHPAPRGGRDGLPGVRVSGLFSPGWAGSAAEESTGDLAFLQALLDAEAALTRAQAAVGLAPSEAAAAVTRAAADATRFDARGIALRAREGGNPVIPLVADLTAAVPADAAPYVHRGATSQDILDTALMLVAERTLDPLLTDLSRTERALARLASRHRDTVLPGRTLTQHAVPTTFGLKAAGWRSLVLDARERVAGARAALPVQLGGAAGTLAAFQAYGGGGPGGLGERGVPGLVAAFARELALVEPLLPWHTLRTPVADLAAALAFTAGALGKAAVDVATLSRTEIGELSEGSGGGSSAMPHKANPVRATLITAAARRAPALAATLLGSLAAEDERPAGAWHAEWEPLRDQLAWPAAPPVTRPRWPKGCASTPTSCANTST